MNKFEKINLQVEIINYTTDRVYYYEDLYDAIDTLGNLQDKNPSHEIGVSHFSIYGANLPFNDENVEFVEKTDADEIVATVVYYENIYVQEPNVSLYDVKRDMENYASVGFYYGDNEAEAFEEYANELGLLYDVPEHVLYYINYEKMLRDYTYEGLTVLELPYEGMERKYMFVNR